VLATAYFVRPIAALEDARASVLWQDRSTLDDMLVRTVHSAGAKLMVWTVDDPDEMARFIRWGVDGICTNYPERARRAVDASRAA
jgi:glycerophosphoryl diester phosphodiesterase